MSVTMIESLITYAEQKVGGVMALIRVAPHAQNFFLHFFTYFIINTSAETTTAVRIKAAQLYLSFEM